MMNYAKRLRQLGNTGEEEEEPSELSRLTPQLQSLVSNDDYEAFLMRRISADKDLHTLAGKINAHYQQNLPTLKVTEQLLDAVVEARATEDVLKQLLQLAWKNKPKTRYELFSYVPQNLSEEGKLRIAPVAYPDALYPMLVNMRERYNNASIDTQIKRFADCRKMTVRGKNRRHPALQIEAVKDSVLRITLNYGAFLYHKPPQTPRLSIPDDTATDLFKVAFLLSVHGFVLKRMSRDAKLQGKYIEGLETQVWEWHFPEAYADNLYVMLTSPDIETVMLGFQTLISIMSWT